MFSESSSPGGRGTHVLHEGGPEGRSEEEGTSSPSELVVRRLGEKDVSCIREVRRGVAERVPRSHQSWWCEGWQRTRYSAVARPVKRPSRCCGPPC